MSPTIIWINLPFGVGGNGLANTLHDHLPNSFIFDPEEIRSALKKLTPHDSPECQNNSLWIPLTLDALQHSSRDTRKVIIVPVPVDDIATHRKLNSGLKDRGITVQQFTLINSLVSVHAELSRNSKKPISFEYVQDKYRGFQSDAFKTHLSASELSINEMMEVICSQVGIQPTMPPVVSAALPAQAAASVQEVNGQASDPLRWLKAIAGIR